MTRGDRNFRCIRVRGGEAREMVLLPVFIRGATEISALQLTRAISGGKIFQRLSTSARVHAALCVVQSALPRDLATLVKRTPQVCGYIFYTDLPFSFLPFPSLILSFRYRNSKLVLSFSLFSHSFRPISISRTNNDEKRNRSRR